MTKLQRVKLFYSFYDIALFIGGVFLIFIISLSYEYYQYKQLTKYPTTIVQAKIIKHYIKTKNKKTYQVVKLQLSPFHTFYTTTSKKYHIYDNALATLKLYTKHIQFIDFLQGFYAKGWFLEQKKEHTFYNTLLEKIQKQHTNKNITTIYQALFLAAPLSYELYQFFSTLGVSHLFAISGFHLGILSSFFYLLLQPFFSYFYKLYFPYRNKKRDLFFLIAILLFGYLYLLDFPHPLVRAYSLMVVGFFFYDRGVKLISLENLFITLVLLLALFPPLFFSLGFWLSILGVFYIVLFFIHFQDIKPMFTFFYLPIWVYLMMLPTTLFLFHTFSFYHPLSIFLTLLFSFFYPLTFVLHLIGFGNLFDPYLLQLLQISIPTIKVNLPMVVWILFLFCSFISIKIKKLTYFLLLFSLGIIFTYI